MARENVHASGHVEGLACRGEVKAMGLFAGGCTGCCGLCSRRPKPGEVGPVEWA